jgi:single-strand DNA-binding protein
LASSQRRFDRTRQKWVDGDTNWYTITAFRQLASNVTASIKKGERVVVTGRLRIRDWESGERAGTNIEIDADAIGHDLSWGTASFSRSVITSKVDDESFPSETGTTVEGEQGATSGGRSDAADDPDLADDSADASADASGDDAGDDLDDDAGEHSELVDAGANLSTPF